jgi:hypothetical protein
MQSDPRQWKVVIDGRPLVSLEELINHLHEAGFRVVSGQDLAVLNACAAIPDVTLSKWACSPGKMWEPVRLAVKLARRAAGFNVDAEIDGFDHDTGMLLARQRTPVRECDHKFIGPKTCAKCGVHIDELRERSRREAEELLQHAPSPDYSTSEKS